MTLKEAATNSLLMFVAATCVVLIVKAVSPTPTGPGAVAATANPVLAPTPAIADGFKVYYLHGNIRCPTCRTIEATAREAVETGFAEQLKSGQLEWQVINYESPGNEHYATDYEVVAPTVVMAEFTGGQQKKWKAIPESTQRVHGPTQCRAGVERESAAIARGIAGHRGSSHSGLTDMFGHLIQNRLLFPGHNSVERVVCRIS
jgi:hypothetical protein